ncbi:MAG: hypothetical protein ACNA71_08160, partial [Kiritimatiellia bacterium]
MREHLAIRTLAAVLTIQGASVLFANSEQFAADTAALLTVPHRLAGSQEAQAAATHVAGRLRDIGMDAVIEHPFITVGMEVIRCEVEIARADGQLTRPLQPMRPNGMMLPVTPPEGISGKLVHFDAASGDFGAGGPTDNIVVLDYNARSEWLRAFRMGARAVIFTRANNHHARYRHTVEADANLPRFYYDGPVEDLKAGAEITIHSTIRWKRVTGNNVYGLLRGSEPTFQFDWEEWIVLATQLDAFGEVPLRAPGARRAANVAALLAMAEDLQAQRPRRNILFAFVDGDTRGYAGSAAMYQVLDPPAPGVSVDARLENLLYERQTLEQVAQSLEAESPLETGAVHTRRDLRDRLRAKAETQTFDVRYSLFGLREELQATDAGTDTSALQKEITAKMTQQDAWNDLRRYLVAPDAPPEDEALHPLLAIIMDEVREDVRIRTIEIAEEVASAEAGRNLQNTVGNGRVSLHLSLVFGDARPRWAFITGSDSDFRSRFDQEGLYARVQGTMLTAVRNAREAGQALAGFETRSVDGFLASPRLLWGAPWLVHGGDIAGMLGIYNGVLGTVLDPLTREGTPCDTLENLDLDVIATQAREAAVLTAYLASEPGLSLRRSIRADSEFIMAGSTPTGTLTGPRVMARSPGSSVPNRRMHDTVIRITNRARPEGMLDTTRAFPGFDNFQMVMSNRSGSYSYGPVLPDPQGARVQGFGVVFNENGNVQQISTQDSVRRVSQRLNLFPGQNGAAIAAPQFTTGNTSLMRASGNAPVAMNRSFSRTLDGVVYWYAEDRIRDLKLFGLNSIVRLHNGPDRMEMNGESDLDPQGEGFLLEDTSFPRSAARAAADLWRLNESRLDILRSRGIHNVSIEELHGRAQDLMLDAEEHDAEAVQESMHASSFMMQRIIYNTVINTLNDIVNAVLILLLLAIPFAFALERLLIGSTTIYKRVLGFACFFVATFLILYLTHPAFAISATPIIIFLGFAIVMLSSLVIIVIMNKFEHELKVLQGAASTVHAADVSRMSTILAAMNMGISTMRRRPLRTALTAVTIILLTFTILAFASFGVRVGIVRLFLNPGPTYSGVLVRDVRWGPLQQPVQQIIRARWGDEADIISRYWLSPEQVGLQGILATSENGENIQAMQGVLGIDPNELQHREDLANLLPGAAESMDGRIWLTSAAADMLEAQPGDTIIAGGIAFELAGLVQSTDMVTTLDMDDSSVLPVDFRDLEGVEQQEMTADSMLEQPDWASLPVDSIMIVNANDAQTMGAKLRAITLYTQDRNAAVTIAEDIARISGQPVAVTTPQGAYRFMLGNVVQASGFQDLFFPILLGGLVVFGT